MQTTIVTIPADRITDWESFHSVFKQALGFPDFYGRNMDAWNDCMTYLDDPTERHDERLRGERRPADAEDRRCAGL
jgi:hypothetical protein